MVSTLTEIPGLFSSETQQQTNLPTPFEGLENSQSTNLTSPQNDRVILLPGRSMLQDLLGEKERLDPSLTNCHRLLEREIARVQVGGDTSHMKQTEKLYIPLEDQRKHNVVGRLLGPKGLTLKRIQAETQTKMSILGRGSMRDRKKEEELRNSDNPAYSHLMDDLHVSIDAAPPYSTSKLAAGVAEVKKMLIPLEPGQPDLIAAKYLDHPGGPPGLEGGYPAASPLKSGGFSMRGGDRGGRGGRGGPGRGAGGRGGLGRGGGGRARGGPPRGLNGRGGERPMRGGGGWGGREGGGGGGRGKGPMLEGGGGGFGYGAGKKSPWREDKPSHSESRPYGGVGVSSGGGGPPPDRDVGGYGGRRSSFGGEGAYGRLERYEESDPYYSSFSDPPLSPVSRDYHHGSSSGASASGGGGSSSSSEWKAGRPSRRDYRHHPYQQPSGGYY